MGQIDLRRARFAARALPPHTHTRSIPSLQPPAPPPTPPTPHTATWWCYCTTIAACARHHPRCVLRTPLWSMLRRAGLPLPPLLPRQPLGWAVVVLGVGVVARLGATSWPRVWQCREHCRCCAASCCPAWQHTSLRCTSGVGCWLQTSQRSGPGAAAALAPTTTGTAWRRRARGGALTAAPLILGSGSRTHCLARSFQAPPSFCCWLCRCSCTCRLW